MKSIFKVNSIKYKIVLINIMIVFLFLVIQVYQFNSFSKQINSMVELKEKSLQTALLSQEIKLSVVQVQQWLTDISATRGIEGFEDGFTAAENYAKQFANQLQEIEALNPDAEEQMQEIETAFNNYYEVGVSMAHAYIDGGPTAGNIMMSVFDLYGANINKKVEEFKAQSITDINDSLSAITASLSSLIKKSVIILFGVLFLSIFLSLLISNRITKPIKILMEKSEQAANGNLKIVDNKMINQNSADEIGHLSASFNIMINNLVRLITNVSNSSQNLAAASQELSASAEQSAQATSQVASSISETAAYTTKQSELVDNALTLLEEVSSGIHQINSTAQIIAQKAQNSAQASNNGSDQITFANEQMRAIEKSVKYLAEVITKLGDQSQEIGEIVDAISGIAGQTNLLALNAAIEAARAGEQGRGFAVVAEEVRKLAEQSQGASNKIADLIDQIQKDTKKAVAAMGIGTEEVTKGIEVMHHAELSFEEISGSVSEVLNQVEGATTLMQNISSQSEKLLISVRDIDTISKEIAGQAQTASAATQEQTASDEEIASSSENLAQMAQDLQKVLNKFKV
ncbi:MAG: hypothetical protein APF84_07950 [Gracilibacter sp. BRH_c7a]|nr:MAG: hypothetical protein APF84_07950 [Gracilibacter sp. BRH_c7a]